MTVTNAQYRLARAVLLFHRGGPWTDEDRATWLELTGEDDATTKVLCDLARRMIEDAGTWRERQHAEVTRSGSRVVTKRDSS